MTSCAVLYRESDLTMMSAPHALLALALLLALSIYLLLIWQTTS